MARSSAACSPPRARLPAAGTEHRRAPQGACGGPRASPRRGLRGSGGGGAHGLFLFRLFPTIEASPGPPAPRPPVPLLDTGASACPAGLAREDSGAAENSGAGGGGGETG